MTSYHIKRPANTHYKINPQIAAVRSEKSLLSGGRHSNEKTVGATILDFLHHLVFLVLLEIAIPGAGKFNGGITSSQRWPQLLQLFLEPHPGKTDEIRPLRRSLALPQKGQFLLLAP